MVRLYELLYKKAYYYFGFRHADDQKAEDLASGTTQKVWEALLRCESLASVRQPAAFFAIASRAIVRECWRVQTGAEKEPAPPASNSTDDDDDWLENLFVDQGTDQFALAIRDCLLQALGRLKNPLHRTVIILKYIADLDDGKIAAALNMTPSKLLTLQRQAMGHGLDPVVISRTLDIPVTEMQAGLEWIRSQGLADDAIARVVGIAEDRLQSLRSLVKKRGSGSPDDRLLARVFRISPEDLARAHKGLATFPIRRFEVALAVSQAMEEMQDHAALAEDHEIALILGTTKDNIQVILSRVKAMLRKDNELVKCIGEEGL